MKSTHSMKPSLLQARLFPVSLYKSIILSVAWTCFSPVWASAQVRLPFSFDDPSSMLDKAFGEDSDEDREELEKIEVSMEEEQNLGNEILNSGLASLKEAGIKTDTKGRDVEYVQSIVDTLKPMMRNRDRYKKVRVLVARSPKIDARSCPGGTLIFYDGLLDAAGSEAALAVIVGHELSHLDRGHQLLPIRRMKMMENTFSSPQNFTNFMRSGPMMTKMWARPFRPEDERDADSDGVAWAYAAGYDPREAARLFEKNSAQIENAPWAKFFRSHPFDHERHQAILDQVVQLQNDKPTQKPLFVGKENLKKRFSRTQEMAAAKK